MEKIVKEGKKTQIDFDAKYYDIYYYNMMVGNKQYWFFVNNDATHCFDGSVRLSNLVNLQTDCADGDEVLWTIKLEPTS